VAAWRGKADVVIRLALAVHEASHCLVCDALTSSVITRVALIGEDEGRFQHTHTDDPAENLLIAVAGGVGEEVLHGRARCVSALDRQQAREAVAELRGVNAHAIRAPEAEPLYAEACSRVRGYLSAHADLLRHVASQLDQRGRLTGIELRAIAQQYDEEQLQARRAAIHARYSHQVA